MAKTNAMNLTEGSVTKKLILFAFPILMTNLLQQLYNVADRVVVGQFAENGKTALAAIGSTGTANVLFLNAITGLGLGVNVICANHRGAREQEKMDRCIHSSMLLSIVLGILIACLGVVLCEPLLRLLGTPADVLQPAVRYMRICFLGVPASSIVNFGAGILRANGDTKRPMVILGLSGLVNVALNLVLVAGFRMSVAGVAVATVIAQYISAILVLRILCSPKDVYKMQRKKLRFHGESVGAVVRVGVPMALNFMVFTLSNLILQSSLNTFGSTVLAGKTAAQDISSLVYQGVGAASVACVSFVGQCFGAKDYKRIDRVLGCACGIALGYVAVMATICTLFPRPILGMFNSDPQVIDAGISVLMVNIWGYMIYSMVDIPIGCLRGMGQTAIPSLMNFLGVCVPKSLWVLFIFPMKHDLTFLYLSYPVAWAIGAVMQWGYYFYIRKKLLKADSING